MITPTLEQIYGLASELNLPKPISHRPVYNVWFRALHEVGHHAVVPQWYKNYSDVIHYDPTFSDAPCAPSVPCLWLTEDPIPDETCVRLWVMQVAELFGWESPVVTDPSIFGGKGFNPKQWYMSTKEEEKCNKWLLDFGIDVKNGKLLSNSEDINLPYPNGVTLEKILANHDYIYKYYGLSAISSTYNKSHMQFLNYLSNRLVAINY